MGTQGKDSWFGSSVDGDRIETEIDDTPREGEEGEVLPALACSDEMSSEGIMSDWVDA
jgi:hypothetical protein